MSWLLGIDIGHQSVRVVQLRTSYRHVTLESVQERSLSEFPSIADAIRACVPASHARTESVATNLEGDREFIRLLDLPPTAVKQLAEVLPFELEAQLPFELDQTVFDSRPLPRHSSSEPLQVLCAVARTDDVRERIDLIRSGAGLEPQNVEPACVALGNLAPFVPELQGEGPIAVAHLDTDLTDVVFLKSGQVHFARTVSGGTGGLPASAVPLARDLRQTLMAWRAVGGAVPTALYLTGPGALLSGAEAFLTSELGMPVTPLPTPKLEGITPENTAAVIRATRAIALGLGLTPRARGLNLRRGPLAYERGYGFLRDKVPLLAGLGAVIAVSFLFSTWVEAHTLATQRDTLEEALGLVTKQVLGETIRDPEKAMDTVGPGTTGADEDPMPHMDAFDVLVQLSKAVPDDIVHDVEELDVQRGKVTINGIVPTIPDTQTIADNLKEVACFRNVKVVRTSQAVNADKQKYVMEFEIRCPGEGTDKDKKKDKESAAAEAASSEAPVKAEGK